MLDSLYTFSWVDDSKDIPLQKPVKDKNFSCRMYACMCMYVYIYIFYVHMYF